MVSTLRPDFAGRPRLQCDEMLASLARWLRAAGHDAAIAPSGTADAEVLARCRRDDRLLLTRDRALAQAAAGIVPTHLLASDRLDAQARELAGAGLDWRLAPFTRCIADNVPVIEVASDKIALVPPPFQARPGDLRFCPACERLYWPGGHVRRMLARLEGWAG